MRVDRLPFEELPEATRRAIADRVGENCPRAEVENGTSSALASLFWPSALEMVFLKGLPLDHERIGELQAEAAVNPFLPDSAPKVLWKQEAGGWFLVCFEGANATAWAYFGSDSDHLEPVAAVLRELSRHPAPQEIRFTPWARWGDYCDPADEPLLTGDRLVHCDPCASNFMIERSGRVWMIDWAWAMRGPAWIDTALWGMRLVLDGGQTPQQAAAWARTIPAFADAPREAVAVLTEAEARSWEAWQAYGMTGLEGTIKAARAWARYWASP
ncbi:aminoglycoside phosphotransferase [Streptomyces sp. BE147]|uniref:phosphotransferase family protein n=1 Tax=Streptomyces sp. BE147 TaxID=3002524 RepID=UPI002E771031|nr:aminoglycoside phosphotransferase [Streptomyces sp. BE147]MEE1741175.1 aminoglycoside phosphotransferase [Streptomyces sp. BE147]